MQNVFILSMNAGGNGNILPGEIVGILGSGRKFSSRERIGILNRPASRLFSPE